MKILRFDVVFGPRRKKIAKTGRCETCGCDAPVRDARAGAGETDTRCTCPDCACRARPGLARGVPDDEVEHH